MIVVDPSLMRRFMEYHWPGNVRELRNFIEYGIHFSQGSTITWNILAGHFEREPAQDVSAIPPGPAAGKILLPGAVPFGLRKARQGVSADLARAAVEKHGVTVTGKRAAAKELGISLATLYRVLSACL
jgi:DNA-binding NtrC family response regulator